MTPKGIKLELNGEKKAFAFFTELTDDWVPLPTESYWQIFSRVWRKNVKLIFPYAEFFHDKDGD